MSLNSNYPMDILAMVIETHNVVSEARRVMYNDSINRDLDSIVTDNQNCGFPTNRSRRISNGSGELNLQSE